MPLPVSGPISLAQIQSEFGGTNPVSLSEYYRNGVFVANNNTSIPASGAISIRNFYGVSRQFAFTISTNQTNANLRTLAVAAGWDQFSEVVCTVNSGVYLSSNSTGTPGLTVNGAFPSGVTLINNGFIVGMGGAGGNGATAEMPGAFGNPATAGGNGGTALSVSVGLTVANNGTIGGGGGGGGGGGSASVALPKAGWYTAGGGGGGGGRTGLTNSSAGSGGFGFSTSGGNGVAGSFSSAGSGGGGSSYPASGGDGGAGGGWGSSGATGGDGVIVQDYGYGAVTVNPGGSGGSAGAAVSGNSNITWSVFGTRLGAIT